MTTISIHNVKTIMTEDRSYRETEEIKKPFMVKTITVTDVSGNVTEIKLFEGA